MRAFKFMCCHDDCGKYFTKSKGYFPDIIEQPGLAFCPDCAPQYLPKPAHDAVARPAHYTWHPTAECQKIVAEFPYNLGTAIAYIWRAERKNGVEDLEKAIEHLKFEAERWRKVGRK